MPMDGVTIASIVFELKEKLLGGRIDKIYQPEKDEIIINIRSLGNNYKLLMTASASHPRLHLTAQSKENPMQAPLFCMVMRKHITGGKIVGITQPHFERIVCFHIEALNEMGDVARKSIIIEIMGRHSNIILTDENSVILDAVKHISHDTSAVREVLPGKPYATPPDQGKRDPMALDHGAFTNALTGQACKAQEALYKSYSGVSPFLADELCFRAGVDPDVNTKAISAEDIEKLYNSFAKLFLDVQNGNFDRNILYVGGKPAEFSCVSMTLHAHEAQKSFDTVSDMLITYYGEKDTLYRVGQKTADIRKLIQQNIERCVKKKALYIKTFRDIEDRDQLKTQGELLTANIHALEKGMTAFTTVNYYDENMPELTIALDPNLTPAENAQRYFRKYNKAKRTFAALKEQTVQNDAELNYLESLLTTLSTCSDEADMEELRDELAEQGFAKRRKKTKGAKPKKAKPLHFISSDGFDIYVGKNNKQNDELTLRFAENSDIWFHTKDIPGSHVIVQTMGRPVPDATLNEAALLAAFYSKGKNGSHVPVDFTTKKNVKKPNGAKPGMVIYDHYQTAVITPDESLIRRMRQTP